MSLNKNHWKLIFSLILLFFVTNSVFAQTETEAKSTVEKFYKYYRTRNGAISTHEINFLKGWFTPELTRLFRYEIKREDEYIKKNPNDKPYFGDGFPFQPYEECVIENKVILNRLEVGKVESKLNLATVEVMFFIPKECEDQVETKLLDTFKIELIKSKSKWLINDWIYEEKDRLSKILKREKY